MKRNGQPNYIALQNAVRFLTKALPNVFDRSMEPSFDPFLYSNKFSPDPEGTTPGGMHVILSDGSVYSLEYQKKIQKMTQQ